MSSASGRSSIPSTVRISAPSACAANIRQDLIGSPSFRTVQAPQLPVSQPMCVPVMSRSSRIAWTSRRRGSTSIVCSVPLTVSVISRSSVTV